MSSLNACGQITRPLQIECDSRERPSVGLRTCDFTGYRLARLEAEVLEPARSCAPAASRLHQLISAYVKLAISDPGIASLISQRYRGSATEPPFREESDSVGGFLAAIHRNLSQVMETRDRTLLIDPDLAAHSLLGIIHWGINCHRTENRLGHDEAAIQIAALALHGLVPHPTGGASPG